MMLPAGLHLGYSFMAAAQPDAKPLSLAVLISGGGTTLENLILRIRDRRLRGVQIQLVISSRTNVRGVAIARAAGLPAAVVRRKDFADTAGFSAAISRTLDAAAVDLVLLAGFLCFWHVPERYLGRVLNIHPALLPAFGGKGLYGRYVHTAVLAAGASESGCTVHLVDNEYDHGPIVAQARVPVLPGDTPDTLAARVMEVEREMYPQVIQRIADEGLNWLREIAARGGAAAE